MMPRGLLGSIVLAAIAAMSVGARAQEGAKYPDWAGQWTRASGAQWDPTKPPGKGQQAPLTPEYQAIFESTAANIAAGGQDNNPTSQCIPPGMPRIMIMYESMEIVITPQTTYMLIEYADPLRRIYTDGRQWPDEIEPTYVGYSIGKWQDTDGDGRYDTLTVETRAIKGPRNFDGSGLPLHRDNQTVVTERLYSDKTNSDILHNEITTVDHALTRPWTVMHDYKRSRKPIWDEYVCQEDNRYIQPHGAAYLRQQDTRYIQIGTDSYVVSGDGYLMPLKKGQAPPDLKYFNQPAK
jgi:hypothetical protein